MDQIKVFTSEEIASGVARQWVVTTLDRGQSEANYRQRSRVVWLDSHEVGTRVENEPDGEVTASGGGVPNAYRQRAETTILGVAWTTTSNRNRHVRIVAHRTTAPRSAYGKKDASVFPNDSYAGRVYPFLVIGREARKRRRKEDSLRNRLRDAVAENGVNEMDLRVLLDHVMETGDRPLWYSTWFVQQAEQYLGIQLPKPDEQGKPVVVLS